MSKRALIVVDIQNDHYVKWTSSDVEAAARNAARLVTAGRSAGYLVVHIRHEFPTADRPFFQPGSEGAALHPSVINFDSVAAALGLVVSQAAE
jgi:nicotinamidase-related amidase